MFTPHPPTCWNSQFPIDATPGHCLTVNVAPGQPSATLLEAVHTRLVLRSTSTEFQKFSNHADRQDRSALCRDGRHRVSAEYVLAHQARQSNRSIDVGA